MGTIDVTRLSYHLPGGRQLFSDVTFKVGDGQHVALVGANGVGKTTLMGIVGGRNDASSGTVSVDGRLGVMDQLVGMRSTERSTVRDLFASLAPPAIGSAARELADATRAADPAADEGKPSFVEKAGLRLAQAHAD